MCAGVPTVFLDAADAHCHLGSARPAARLLGSHRETVSEGGQSRGAACLASGIGCERVYRRGLPVLVLCGRHRHILPESGTVEDTLEAIALDLDSLLARYRQGVEVEA